MITYAFVWGEITILGTSFKLVIGSTSEEMAEHMVNVQRKILADARARFVAYGSEKSESEVLRATYEKTAKRFKGASGVLDSGTGSYITVGQTLRRSRIRPRPQYTELQLRKAIIPARDASMGLAKRGAMAGVNVALRQNGL